MKLFHREFAHLNSNKCVPLCIIQHWSCLGTLGTLTRHECSFFSRAFALSPSNKGDSFLDYPTLLVATISLSAVL